MNSGDQKTFLELESIWKDEDIFEMSVMASNHHFSGMTKVYDQYECLAELAKKLIDFPKGNNSLFYEAGEKDHFSYFSMKYYPIDQNGHIGVEIYMEGNTTSDARPEEKDKLKMEIIVEPHAIDNFQKELNNMAKNKDGKAILTG